MASAQTGTTRILSVVWYHVLPPRFGGQKGVAFFNENLGRLAPLTCLCSKNNEVKPASYTITPRLPVGKTQFLSPFCWKIIVRLAKKQKVTHLILEFPYYGFAGVLCRVLTGCRLIVHAHNIESLRFKEQGKRWWPLLAAYEKWTLRKADAVFLKTENDRQYALQHFKISPERTMVLPYGITRRKRPDRAAAKELIYQRHQVAAGTKILLFAGTLDYRPNTIAVKAMAQNLVPLLDTILPAYKIIICGRTANQKQALPDLRPHEAVFYAGNVPDIDTYFAAADVFINPVTMGGGVQTKSADALAFDLSVVCFNGMQQGLTGAEKKIFAVAKADWDGFARATAKALQDPSPTPDLFFEQHDWVNIAQKAFHFIQTI